jgi:hypothetical protein
MREFELRWVYVQGEPSCGSICIGENIFQKLQIRKREGPRGEDWWGDWVDVPVGGGSNCL